MTEVDCSEVSADEQIALAGEITESLRGKGFALIKGPLVVIDQIAPGGVDESALEGAVADFISRRKESAGYSLEKSNGRLLVRSPDPIAASHHRRTRGLPPNLMKCPFCPFVTPYEEAYVVHYRSHGFGV